MKLYAAVTSERASKGQGGNEWIEFIMSIDKDVNKQVRLYADGIHSAYMVEAMARNYFTTARCVRPVKSPCTE